MGRPKNNAAFLYGTTEMALSNNNKVLFNPPPGAYSPNCLQHRFAGEEGMIWKICDNEYAVVQFASGRCLCNLAYCEKKS